MEIVRVKIGGFRNIDDTTIELDDITSLLSINSYGKSNYLNGIIFGIDFIHAPVEIKSKMMDYNPYKPFNKKIFLKNFSFEIEFLSNADNNGMSIIYGYSFVWKKDEESNPTIVKEFLKVKDNKSQKYSTFIDRGEKALYKPSVTSACNRNINIESSELILNKIMAYDDLYYSEIIKSLNNIKVYVDKHFNTNSAYDIQTAVRKNLSDYRLHDDANVPRILFKIKNDYPDKFKTIVNTLKDIFPFIKGIEIIEYNIGANVFNEKIKNDNLIPANNVYFLVAVDRNIVQPIDFSDMSDGVRRVLLIFTTLTLADINNYWLVGIEEPENSLNPKILQRYLISLKGFSKNTKIIITSHSPYLVNYLNPKNIYLGLPNNDGIATFSKIKEKSINKLLNDADNMDMLVGDYLFDLMSGTEDDLELMIKYVE